MATVYSLVCWGGRTGKTVTLTDAGDIVNSATHGLHDGTPVQFASGTLPSGLALNTTYYAKSTGAGTFTLYTTAALTTQVTWSGAGTGPFVLKSKAAIDYLASPPTTERWGALGSERCYDGFSAWEAARVAAPYNAADEEVCEFGEAFDDVIPYTGNTGTYDTKCRIKPAKTTLTTFIAGTRSTAFHNGDPLVGYFLKNGYGGLICSGYNVELNGFHIVGGEHCVLTQQAGFLSQNMFVSGADTHGFRLIRTSSTFVNTIVYGCGNTGYDVDSYQANVRFYNCQAHKNGTGFRAYPGYETGVYIYCYNCLSVGNTTNWGTVPTLDGASNNAGLVGEAWGTSKVTIATTDFTNYANNIFSPLNSSSPQVEAGTDYYGITDKDILGRARPDYMNGAAEYYDIGAYEFDHGYGPRPITASLTLTGLSSGTDVVVRTASTSTILDSVDSTSGAWVYTYATPHAVDIDIIKPGMVIVTFRNLSLTSVSSSLPIAQQTDRNYS